MASQILNLVLNGKESGLKSALEKVEGAVNDAKDSLEELDNDLSQLAEGTVEADSGVENLNDEVNSISKRGKIASQTVDSLKRDISELGGSAQGTTFLIEEFSGELVQGAASSSTMEKAVNSLKDEVEQLRNSEIEASISTGALSGAQKELAATNQATQSSLDEAADEADDLRNSYLQAAGAAELFNLSSSALSINVGFMTVALRNATTQIPALVAGLGNLGSAFMGVAGAAGLAAGGIAGVLVGGFLAEVEGMTGELEDSENTMEAMAAIGQEVRDMFIEALEPLMEMQGAAEAFKSIIEGLATTVRAFSKGLARSFETDQFYGIREFMDEVGGSFMDNLSNITAAMNQMFANLGPIIASMLIYAIERFDSFAEFITEKTLIITDIFNQVRGELGNFIRGFIELGTVLGAALIPVLNAFFGIMADIAQVLSNVNPQAIALVVQVGGLVLILNKLAGVTSNMLGLFGAIPAAIIQSAHAASSFSDAVKIMSNRMQEFLSKHFKGFADLGSAITTATSGMRNFGVSIKNASSDQLPNFLVSLGQQFEALGSKATSFSMPSISYEGTRGSPLDKIPEMDSSGVQIPKTYTGFDAIRESFKDKRAAFISSIRRGGISGAFSDLAANIKSGSFSFLSSIEGKINDLGKATSEWGKNLPGKISNIGERMNKLGGRTGMVGATMKRFGDTLSKDGKGLTDAFASSLGTLSAQMIASGGITGAFGKMIQYMTRSLRDGKGVTGAMKNALAALTGSQYGASFSTMAHNAALGIYNTLTTIAVSVTAALAVTVGALAAALLAIAAIGGAVVLMLASLGSSGMSAKEILTSLKQSFLDIAGRVMPIFIASANAIKDILDALARPFKVIQDELGGSGSAFGMLQSAADALTAVMVPLLLSVGDLATAFGNHLAKGTKAAMPLIKSFVGLGKSLKPLLGGVFEGILLLVSGIKSLGAIAPYVLKPIYMMMEAIAWVLGKLVDGIALMIDGLVKAGSIAKDIASIDTSNIEGASKSAEEQLAGEDIQTDDAMKGGGILADLKQQGMAKVSPSEPSANINYDEGDTMNNYKQDISANPEDKAQIGRIAKDAMEEANSFARKNQGGY